MSPEGYDEPHGSHSDSADSFKQLTDILFRSDLLTSDHSAQCLSP